MAQMLNSLRYNINIRFMPAMLTFNILTLNLRILLANYYKTKVVDPAKILFSFLMDLTCEYNNVQNHYKSIGRLNPCLIIPIIYTNSPIEKAISLKLEMYIYLRYMFKCHN